MGLGPTEAAEIEARADLPTAPDGLAALDDRPPGGARDPGPLRALLAKHHRKLWWLHSFYALGLGVFVVIFAQRGYQYARWLTLSLVAIWLILLTTFRIVGSGRAQKLDDPKLKLRFLVMTYLLKNLYQTMLFFLLPFYWRTATIDAGNRWFVVGLALCTVLATLDLVFDRVLMRWRLVASVYYVMALFSCLNLAIPALWPMPASWSLLLAAFVSTVAFWTLHVPVRTLRQPKMLGLLALTAGLSVLSAWACRRVVPPVPLNLMHAAVGPTLQGDGRLTYEVSALHSSVMRDTIAVTDVFTPAGAGEAFVHVWRLDGHEMLRLNPEVDQVTPQRLRLRSSLRKSQLPRDKAGVWTIDVETDGGQLVGRFGFAVRD